jgi:hypothetical protein
VDVERSFIDPARVDVEQPWIALGAKGLDRQAAGLCGDRGLARRTADHAGWPTALFVHLYPNERGQCLCKLPVRADLSGATIRALVP